eukprot:TRINITY_DN23847_c0_g1_i2.p1 TRINITY_DN23847_c0_g1~~TRINITY_DN23847_c0_g1_i2.p1  ORF type:complete len:168 (+),score=52.35 TRINITY_DN23847_c0_g1_i2:117-620(+)
MTDSESEWKEKMTASEVQWREKRKVSEEQHAATLKKEQDKFTTNEALLRGKLAASETHSGKLAETLTKEKDDLKKEKDARLKEQDHVALLMKEQDTLKMEKDALLKERDSLKKDLEGALLRQKEISNGLQEQFAKSQKELSSVSAELKVLKDRCTLNSIFFPDLSLL